MFSVLKLAKLVWIAAAVVVDGGYNKPADTTAYLKNSVDGCRQHCALTSQYAHLWNQEGGDAFESGCIAECVESVTYPLKSPNYKTWYDSTWKDKHIYNNPKLAPNTHLGCVETCWYDRKLRLPEYATDLNGERDHLRHCLTTCKELHKEDVSCQAS